MLLTELAAWPAGVAALGPRQWTVIGAALIVSYLVGSIPWAYLIAKWVTGEDITAHGTGNVGAMNVRRTTGSWGWFTVAMLADGFKGIIPVTLARLAGYATLATVPASSLTIAGVSMSGGMVTFTVVAYAMQAAVFGSVLGHNYSLWLAIAKRRYVRTGKGLATGGGALFAYNPLYFVVAVGVALGMIALTKYLMAGQVAAALSLPAFAILTQQPDWPFVTVMGLIVYAAHHKRFVGLLQGREPKVYVNDAMGPRG